MQELLYDDPLPLIFLGLFVVLAVAEEGGFRLGRRNRQGVTEELRAQINTLQTALLGLLALLLGFTFSMALGRFELRRALVVKEANAIGTAALRAQMLAPGQQEAVKALFRAYASLRIEATALPSIEKEKIARYDAETARVQEALWRFATVGATADPRSVQAGLFVSAMNDVIDVKGERDAALRNHVSESVIFLLLGFTALTVGFVGHCNGIAGGRAAGTTTMIAFLIALVIVIILDLDRPRRGFITVDQASMTELQRSLAK